MGILVSACGGSGGADIANLSQLPDSNAMVSTSGSTNAATFAAASGTPPTVNSLAGDTNAAISAFWGSDLITAMSDGVDSQAQISQFFGETVDSAGGEGACRMIETVGRSFSNMAQASGSSCYMKRIPTATSGVTITPALDDASTIFNQQAADRLVQVNPTNMPGDEGSQEIYIKVHGSSSVTADVYKVNLYFCNPDDDSLTGVEEIVVNRKTGAYTTTSTNIDGGEGSGRSYSLISAKLKKSGSGFTFDASSSRSATLSHSYDGNNWSGVFKGAIEITANDQIIAKLYERSHDVGNDQYFLRNIYALANFTGSNAKDVSFTEGGFAGKEVALASDGETPLWGDGAHNFSGGVEYRDTMYFNAGNSSLAQTAASNGDFTSAFYTDSLTVPDVDQSAFDCANAAPDYTIGMDFSDTAVSSIREVCDGHQFGGDGNFCDSNSLRTVREQINSYFQN